MPVTREEMTLRVLASSARFRGLCARCDAERMAEIGPIQLTGLDNDEHTELMLWAVGQEEPGTTPAVLQVYFGVLGITEILNAREKTP